MKKRYLLLGCIMLITIETMVYANKISYPDKKSPLFSLTTPDTWKVSQENNILVMTPKDNAIYFNIFELNQVANWENAMVALNNILKEKIPKLENPEPEMIEINGRSFYFFYGSGLNEHGDKNKITLALFSPKAKTFCIVFYFGPPQAIKQYTIDIQKILLSIL